MILCQRADCLCSSAFHSSHLSLGLCTQNYIYKQWSLHPPPLAIHDPLSEGSLPLLFGVSMSPKRRVRARGQNPLVSYKRHCMGNPMPELTLIQLHLAGFNSRKRTRKERRREGRKERRKEGRKGRGFFLKVVKYLLRKMNNCILM
jgi:hypothetical protein